MNNSTLPRLNLDFLNYNQIVSLRVYAEQVSETDQLPETDLQLVLFGLFGEVGSVMATIKKKHRDKNTYSRYKSAVIEELGDVLWYFGALCRRLGYKMDEVFLELMTDERCDTSPKTLECSSHRILAATSLTSMDNILLRLGAATSELLLISACNPNKKILVQKFAEIYLQTVQSAAVTLEEIVRVNAKKSRGKFLDPDFDHLPDFDSGFPEEERLPDKFEIVFTERNNGEVRLQWNGVFIGNPVTDNITKGDNYRYHDVFHIAHAAILHWSPTFRALIKQKRRSNSTYGRDQDGGRAIVVEEGLTAWIFSYAKEISYFEGQSRISFDLLKVVQTFIHGYEVERCPLSLWERAILNGYNVFRQLRRNSGGIVIGDRRTRTVKYMPFSKDK